MVYFKYTVTLLHDRCVMKTTNPDGSTTMVQEVTMQFGTARRGGALAPVNHIKPPVHITRYYHGKDKEGFTVKIYTVGPPQ